MPGSAGVPAIINGSTAGSITFSVPGSVIALASVCTARTVETKPGLSNVSATHSLADATSVNDPSLPVVVHDAAFFADATPVGQTVAPESAAPSAPCT